MATGWTQPRAAGTDATPEALWAQCRRADDQEALAQLCAVSAPILFRCALAVTRDHGLAEDAVQEAFLKLVEGASRYDPNRPVLPWLLGVTRNKALQIRRDEGRRFNPHRLVLREFSSELPEEAPGAARTLRHLPQPYRGAALLRWAHDLSPRDIAVLRQEPEGTTRSLLSRAAKHLRRLVLPSCRTQL